MDKQPTEAHQDELAGKLDGEMLEILENVWAHNIGSIVALKDLNSLAVSSGGGVCPYCKGKPYHSVTWGNREETVILGETNKCPTCNGTGRKPIVTKELREIIKEWENGKN